MNNMIEILNGFLKRGYHIHSGSFMLDPGYDMNLLSKSDLIEFFAEGDRWRVNNTNKYVIVTQQNLSKII